MNKKAFILILTAVMLISTLSFALGGYTPSVGTASAANGTATASVYTGSVTIYPNGTVSVPGVFSVSGSTYKLLQNVSGTITYMRNNSVLNGNGFTVSAASSFAVNLEYSSNVSITDLNIGSSNYGIYVYDVANGTFSHITTQSSNYPFEVQDSNGITLSASSFNASTEGIYIEYANSVHVSNVTLTNASYDGVYMYEISGVTIDNVTVSYPTFSYAEGIYLDYGYNFVVKDSKVSGFEYGLDIEYATNVSSFGNTLSHSGYGMYLYYDTNFVSHGDNMSGATYYSLYDEYSWNAVWQYDNFSQSVYGAYLYGGSYASLLHSNFSNVTGSGEYGLFVESVTYTNISYDMFNESAATVYGVYMEYQPSQNTFYMDYIYTPAYYGIYFYDTQGAYVDSTYINAEYGFYADTSTSGTYFNQDTLIVQSYGYALYFGGSINSNIAVTNSTFHATSYNSYPTGVNIESSISSNVVIGNNYFDSVPYAVYVDASSGQQLSVYNNTIVSPYYGVYVYDISGVSITGNTLTNVSEYGLYLEETFAVTATWNTILFNSTSYSDGIYFDYSAGTSVVAHNTITGNASTLQIYSTEGIYVYDNLGQTLVFDNTVSYVYYGLDMEDNLNLSVMGNMVQGGEYGFYSYSNFQFQYYGNQILNSSYAALYSYYDLSGTVFDNTFQNATSYVLYVEYSTLVTFYHNNFINGSGLPTYFYGDLILVWNLSLPTGGNFWSNYTGSGSNGIGTTPYTVNGTNVDYLPLTSRWTSPTLTFVESGLPSGTAWSVTVGQTLVSSSTGTAVYQFTSGEHMTEGYTISAVAGYTANVTSGTVSYTGGSAEVMVTFTPYKYSVTFSETGLQTGASWSVTLGGATKSSTTSTVSFLEANGTYAYTVSGVSGYTGGNVSGSATVSGAGVSESVSYTLVTYSVTVQESGLPSGSSWTVNLNSNGKSYSVSGSNASVVFQVVPGTYTINVTGPSGYTVTLPVSTVSVTGGSSAFVVQFAKSSSSGTGTSPSNSASSMTSLGEGIGVGVVVGAIVGVVAGMFVVPALRGRKKGNQ